MAVLYEHFVYRNRQGTFGHAPLGNTVVLSMHRRFRISARAVFLSSVKRKRGFWRPEGGEDLGIRVCRMSVLLCICIFGSVECCLELVW